MAKNGQKLSNKYSGSFLFLSFYFLSFSSSRVKNRIVLSGYLVVYKTSVPLTLSAPILLNSFDKRADSGLYK